MLFRSHRLPGVDFRASSLDGLLWVLLPVGQTKLAVASIYVPPASSPYFCNQLIERLSSEILHYSRSWVVVLTGDFNAHIGDMPSIIQTPELVFFDRHRCSRLTKPFGKKLVEMCNDLNLLILNGLHAVPSTNGWQPTRLVGDAAVDLIIISSALLPYVRHFQVSGDDIYAIDSDHIPILLHLELPMMRPTEHRG